MRHTLLMTAKLATAALALSASVSAQSPAAAAPKLLPGTRPNVLSSIRGNVMNGSNGPLTDATVRLRDARYGRIVELVTTDKKGAFSFASVDPGNYVVEVMGPGNSVVASSQLMNVGTGETLSALVRIPYKIPALAGLLGNTSQSTASAVSSAAQAVTAAAAASNTVAEALAGAPATATRAANGR